MRLAQQGDQPLDDRRAAVGEMDGPQLGNGGAQLTGHERLSFVGRVSEA
jgi:hypothetical protein